MTANTVRRLIPVAIRSALVFLFLESCGDSGIGPLLQGTYQYSSHDSTGVKIVEGWMTLNPVDSLQLVGEWHFLQVSNVERIGPQVGDGELLGVFIEDTIWIELNPQYRDNNVNLRGINDGKAIRGDWAYSSFAGLQNHGTFVATKQ